MKNKLKTALILSGIIGTSHGADHRIFDENTAPSLRTARAAHTARPALTTIESNLTKVLGLAYDEWTPSSSATSHPFLLTKVIERITMLNKHISKLSQDVKKLGCCVDLAQISDPTSSEQIQLYDRAIQSLHLAIIERDYYSSKVHSLKKGLLPQEERIALERKLFKQPTKFTNTTSGRNQTRTEASLLKEAQKNCLGTVTDIRYNPMFGAKQRVIMSPSTSRQPTPHVASITWEAIVAEVERTFWRTTPSTPPKKPLVQDL